MPREVKNFPKDKSNKVISARVPIDLFNEIYKFVNNEFGPFETMSDFAIDAFIFSLESWDGWKASPALARSIELARIKREAKEAMEAEELYLEVRNYIRVGLMDKAKAIFPKLTEEHQSIVKPYLEGDK